MEEGLGTELENVFPDDGGEKAPPPEMPPPAYSEWSGSGSRDGEDSAYNLEAFVTAETTLASHLAEQMALAISDPARRMIGKYLIDMVDEAGYLSGDFDAVAEKLGAPRAEVEAVLAILQTFDPSGVCARNFSECLAIQLKDRDRYDPAMRALVEHLDLLAKRDFAALRRHCGINEEDLVDMIAEIRNLNPKPGLAFGSTLVQPIVPDVFVRPAPDGTWQVELNSDTLPKVLINQRYYAQVSKTTRKDTDKTYLADCLQTATWLVRALDQRAKTILKVSSEIVRQQDAFFANGVQHLRPLNLKTVADAISMHELTVSRVTANKYMATHARHLRTEIFLHLVDRLGRRRRGAFGRSRAPPHPPVDRRGEPAPTCCPTTPSSRSCATPASTSPAAPSPNTARRCAFPRRCSAAATSRRRPSDGPGAALTFAGTFLSLNDWAGAAEDAAAHLRPKWRLSPCLCACPART